MFVNEEESFCVDQWLGDVCQCLANELFELVAFPTSGELEQLVPGSFELLLVGAEQHIERLSETHPGERSLAEEAGLVERSAERER